MKPIQIREDAARGEDSPPAKLDAMNARIDALVEELRQRTDALEVANRELREVARYRSMMLEHMTHELRTPLTSILGFAEIMLEHEGLSECQHDFCQRIQNSGERLKTTVKQLVDLSRLEAGKTELFLHEFSIRETLREACAATERLTHRRGVALDCETPHTCGAIVSDEGKLRQILYSFLANAIARSPEGARVLLTAEPVSASRIAIEIADEGETLRDPASLFAPQTEPSPARCAEMTGLGLVIAQRLVKLLGGDLKMGALAPRGLVVRLELPSRPAES